MIYFLQGALVGSLVLAIHFWTDRSHSVGEAVLPTVLAAILFAAYEIQKGWS